MIIYFRKYTYFPLLGIIFQLLTINTFSQWIEWEKRSVHDNYEIRSFSVKQSMNGNIIVAGERSQGGYVHMADQFGDSIWSCTNAKGYSLTEDTNGNIYSVYEGFLYKISSSGILVWQKNLSDSMFANINLYKIIISFDNQLIVAGYTQYNGLGSGYIAKYDINGNKIWSNTVNFSGRSYTINNISQLNDGTFLAVGNVNISNIRMNFITKFGINGQLLFNKMFGDSNTYNKTSNSVFQLFDKSYLAFSELGYGSGDSRLVITKLDSSGNFSWRKFYGDTNRLYHMWFGESIIKDKFRNQYLVAGSRKKFLTPPYDTNFCSLASYDSLGSLLWEKMTYSDSFPSYVNGLSQNNDSSYIICGDAFINYNSDLAASPDYLYLLKTKKINPIGISNISSEIPNRFILHQNYPNPFNPVTKIKFELPKSSEFEFNVYDILGRKVYSANYSKPAGTYELDFDASGFASGIYFYSLNAREYKETKKMIILK